MGENNQNTINNSIAWIISFNGYEFTDVTFEDFCTKFINLIPNDLGRLNAKTINEAVRALSDEVIIALRKGLCSYLLSISSALEKNKYHLKKKTKGSTALKEIYELIKIIAENEPITDIILDEYFYLAGDKFQQKNQELIENLFTNIEEIKINISETRTTDHEIKKLNSRMDAIDATLNLIVNMLKNPNENRIATTRDGSNSNPILLDQTAFPSLPVSMNTNSNLGSIFRNNATNPGQTPKSHKRVRLDHLNSANETNGNESPGTNRSNYNNKNNNNNNNNSSKQAKTRSNNQNLRQKNTAQRRLQNFDSTVQSSVNTEIREENPWTLKAKKNKVINKTYRKTVGTCDDETNTIATIKRTYPVYIGRIQNNISTEQITSFLNQKFKKPISDLTKIQLNHSNFSSYFFYIDFLEQSLIKNKEIWPHGLIIDRYNRPRSKPANLSSITTTLLTNSQNSQTNNIAPTAAATSNVVLQISTNNNFNVLNDETNMDMLGSSSSLTD